MVMALQRKVDQYIQGEEYGKAEVHFQLIGWKITFQLIVLETQPGRFNSGPGGSGFQLIWFQFILKNCSKSGAVAIDIRAEISDPGIALDKETCKNTKRKVW